MRVSQRGRPIAMTTMSCRSFEALATVALAFKKIQHYHEEKKRAKVRTNERKKSSPLEI